MNDTFLKACRGEIVDYIPVWFMRQAGRYQAEYRKIKETHSLIDIVHQPELCAKVTLLPIEQLNVDAAILFSDIMTPVSAMGIDFEIKGGYGPYLEKPIRTVQDIEAIQLVPSAECLPYVGETIGILNKELKVPLIGFCGAPFTLSSYLVEGGKSKHYVFLKEMMYSEDGRWHQLMQKVTDCMIDYLLYQVESGAQALQVFDSWVGNLSLLDYEKYVVPYLSRLFSTIKTKVNVPLIYFGLNTYHLLSAIQKLEIDVLGVDYRFTFKDVKKQLTAPLALQGNLDPTLVLAPSDTLIHHTQRILDEMAEYDSKGFIFNLGHGVIPQTNGEILKKIVDFVHERT